MLWIFLVLKQQDIGADLEQFIPQRLQILRLLLACVCVRGQRCLNLLLSIILRLELEPATPGWLKESRFHLVPSRAEYPLQSCVVNIGAQISVHVPQALGIQFGLADGYYRTIPAGQATDISFGNFPNTEKAQNMINAESMKISRHVAQACLPPVVAILGHDLPGIGWESPILTHLCKIIRRRTSLHLETEQLWIYPRIRAISVHTNGKISFEHHGMLRGILGCFRQLLVQMELRVINNTNIIEME
mmetsp:Transcript_22400/g.38674  ORF Transcript_22400/g.38674 Transcript_22400/m.38674 type:complete len:246 (-) Transcript_22400:1711-2448(-)